MRKISKKKKKQTFPLSFYSETISCDILSIKNKKQKKIIQLLKKKKKKEFFN